LDTPLRLVVQRIPPDQAERQRKRVARKSSKQGYVLDPRTLAVAGYLMLMTSLPATAQPVERIVALHRNGGRSNSASNGSRRWAAWASCRRSTRTWRERGCSRS